MIPILDLDTAGAYRHRVTEYLTSAQVATMEGVTVATVLRWCRDNQIWPATLFAGRWFIHRNYITNANKTGRPRVFPKMPKRGEKSGRPMGAKDSYKRNRRWRLNPDK